MIFADMPTSVLLADKRDETAPGGGNVEGGRGDEGLEVRALKCW